MFRTMFKRLVLNVHHHEHHWSKRLVQPEEQNNWFGLALVAIKCSTLFFKLLQMSRNKHFHLKIIFILFILPILVFLFRILCLEN